MVEKKKSMRELMPETAKLIDQMRQLMGKDSFDAILRKAMRGVPGCFYSEENGHTFGTPFKPVNRNKCLYVGREGNLVSYETWLKEREGN